MKTGPERAKELFLQYNGNRYYMALNGEEQEYDGYHVSKATEEMWRREYLTQFFEQKRYGREALGAYATTADFLKSAGDDETWIKFLYYPITSDWLDDVTILFMLRFSFQSVEHRAKKGKLPADAVKAYVQILDGYLARVQNRAEDGTLTRATDYTMQEFADPVYVTDYVKNLRQDWERLL